MNKAITDGIVFMPPAFVKGLGVWSSGNGTPGSDTYAGSGNAAFVPADADFGGCLEIQKVSATQKLRYMGQTPLLPGCYLQIKARIKAVSGPLPSVRIAGWAGGAGEAHVAGLTEQGKAVALTSYGTVFEVTAIVGTGYRDGVDMPWGNAALYGHFGLNLEGPNGGVVRIDDLEIADVTGVFLRDMIGVVDVRDYGARGDGVADDWAAFEAADSAAGGRRVLVPAGTYFLGETTSMNSEIEFEGTVTMPTDKMLLLTKNFDLPTYISAFGDEALAFRKAFQALLNNSDHESLDMGGRKVSVHGPIDMQAAVPNRTSYATRRVIRNGQLDVQDNPAWNTNTYSSQATYAPNNPYRLTGVANIANIPVGALVQGVGVGREVYVEARNVGAAEITLSAPLCGVAGTQSFTFVDFKYLLDFKGFSSLQKFGLEDIEFQCNNRCSAIRLAPSGSTFSLRSCFVSRPKDRGITSIGSGCQGMLIDGCQFLSSEDDLPVPQRTSVALNANANDVKLRHNRATRFRHFAVLGGGNSMVLGNHFFQGDEVPNGTRSAGLVVIGTYSSTTIADNYIDNCHVEWTNERDPSPNFVSGFSFSAMSITDNIFLSGEVAPWFSYVVVRPYGAGHFLNGVTVTGNKFRSINGYIDRAERIDTTFAGLDFNRFVNVVFEGNTYHGVTAKCANPLRVRHSQMTAAQAWIVDPNGELPFGARARGCDSVVVLDPLRTGGEAIRYATPYVQLQQGSRQDQVRLNWPEAVKGTVSVIMRIDK
ncbi:right-handed parallel beta-helix repeat-containing protein [Ruegeria sediminis]|uniref:Right-handed parallel beta-helix repeat-containing protein n=1 Tax=Ruegeria sediminis TaxID=2583820 RepID=A0ABY2X4U6_9RHOB|nr:glycosyl hydrolase family 28-related protein [Ruegeria sediminis]TMV10123.1 right-handed parallel beta-helix repeat-containing protein [Ruegeria sediminis]